MGHYKNKEGYHDPTMGEALRTVSKEEKQENMAVTSLIKMLKQIIILAGFELERN